MNFQEIEAYTAQVKIEVEKNLNLQEKRPDG